jgi:hypothetical protein
MRDEKLGPYANCLGTILECEPGELEPLNRLNKIVRKLDKRTLMWKDALNKQWFEVAVLCHERWFEPFWWPTYDAPLAVVPMGVHIVEFRDRHTDERVHAVSEEGVVLHSPSDPALMGSLELRHFLAWHDNLDVQGWVVFVSIKEVATGDCAYKIMRRHA